MRPRVVLLGAPGVGKGTYAKLLKDTLRVPHISTGDALRLHIATGSPLGRQVQEQLAKGELVSDELMRPLLTDILKDPPRGFLLDGFPRRISQISLLDQVTSIDMALLIKLQDDLLIRKLTARRVCENCGTSYNLAHIVDPLKGINMPALLPKNKANVCDACGGKLVQREDDTLETVQKRLTLYKQTCEPVENEYRKRGTLSEFELTSGVEDMWPLLKKFVLEQLQRTTGSQ